MSELPQISSEELYKSLYEKASKEASTYREQVTSLEIIATKLRDQRDSVIEELSRVKTEIEVLQAKEELLEGEVLD